MKNTFVPKFSYIIPFRFRQDRIIPLRRVVDFISGFQGAEIIIVEQDTHSKISHLNLKATHIFIESEIPFNKSWAYNVGVKNSIAPVLVFADADFILNPNDLIESLKMLETYDCVIPTSNIVNLTPQESAADFNHIFSIKRPGYKFSMTNGAVLFRREAIQKIGGWNEDFIGLSQENQFQDIKIKNLLNYKELDFTGYHLNHRQDPPDFTFAQRNNQIMDTYRQATTEVLNQHISQTSFKIGLKNKYSSL